MAQKKASDRKEEMTLQTINRESVGADAFISLYINDLQVHITPWDFRFILGVIDKEPIKGDPSMNIKTLGEIRMSPQFAKRVLEVLVSQIKHYEESVGQIPMGGQD